MKPKRSKTKYTVPTYSSRETNKTKLKVYAKKNRTNSKINRCNPFHSFFLIFCVVIIAHCHVRFEIVTTLTLLLRLQINLFMRLSKTWTLLVFQMIRGILNSLNSYFVYVLCVSGLSIGFNTFGSSILPSKISQV